MQKCFVISLLHSSACFEHYCAHHQEVKLYNTASGIITPVGGRPVHKRTTKCDDTRCCIIKFDLLMISKQCSKHVEEYNKLIVKQEFVN